MKRALKNREKAVLNNNPSSDGVPVEPSTDMIQKTNRRSGTQAAMIGLAISMGATSLLVTRQSDQAQAAAPVGTQKAASTIPAVSETEIKFAAIKLESQAISSASAPENPVIVEPTAVSPVPGLEAKWPVAAKEVAVQIPTLEANGKAIYLPTPAAEVGNTQSVKSRLKAAKKVANTEKQLANYPIDVATQSKAVTLETANTVSNDVDQQLKAQQEFALTRLQEKSNRLRNSLAELRSEETNNSLQPEQTFQEVPQPTKLANKNIAKSENIKDTDKNQTSLVSKLKQDKQTTPDKQAVIPVAVNPTVVSESVSTTYEVKPGDTLAEIASNHGTSISEIVKANNLHDPNHLQINQKLIIPTDGVANNSYEQPQVVTARIYNQPKINKTVTLAPPRQPDVDTTVISAALSKPDLEANLPAVPQTPEKSNNDNISISVPQVQENQAQVNTPTISKSVSIPVPVAKTNPLPTQQTEITPSQVSVQAKLRDTVEQNQVTENTPQTVSKVKGPERIRSLQVEIERLRQKYRTQESEATVAKVTENESIPVPVAVDENTKDVLAAQLKSPQSAVSIPVPKPNLPSYQEQPKRQLLSAVRSRNNEPINPQFIRSKKSSSASTTRGSSGINIPVPPANMDSNNSLGKLRGTSVSPRLTPLPPLAAVDIYLPKPVDQTTKPGKAFIWPAQGVLTSGYGWRWGRMHRGIDIANGVGTPIYAAADGVVERSGWNRGGYGNVVDIRHPDGSMTRYAHNSRNFVRVGQRVEQGQTIAAMGSTGFSTGPHSHFELHRAGKGAIDPIALLPKKRP